MTQHFNNKDPIYLQIKRKIEDQIIGQHLEEHDQIPSTNEMVNFYKVNHITVSKGVNLLVEDGILYKKRGIGMFVAEGARENLIQNRKSDFVDRYLLPMIREANKLGFTDRELANMIERAKERVSHES